MDAAGDPPLRRIGVLGGTFDPLHLGHLVAASEALAAFELDRVMFVPAARPWQKVGYSHSEDRFLMTTLGIGHHPRFAVSRIELDRKGPTYTVDTMEYLRDFHGGEASLYFVAGADAVLNLDTWEGLDKLGALAEVIAMTRPGFDLEVLRPGASWPKIHVMEMPVIGISATDVRSRVRAGRPIDYLVPAEVAAYIRDQGLYVGAAEKEANQESASG